MKRVLFGVSVALILAGAQVTFGQSHGNPFVDHSDRGETVHVLPAPALVHNPHETQPIDAPPSDFASVFPASYGAGNLANHGGPQIPSAKFFQVYFGSSAANAGGTSLGYATLQAEINGFINNFGGSIGGPTSYASNDPAADYTIIHQYGTSGTPIAFAIGNGGAFVDTTPPKGSRFSDSQVRSYLAGLFDSGKITSPDPDTIYGIYFPSGVKISLQGGTSCSSFCGYHGNFTYLGKDIKYAVFPYTNCRACSLAGKAVLDILTMVTSHEIREAVTDPDLDSWYDGQGYEADDKCAWHNLYPMTRGGFWVQPEYSNGGTVSGTTYPGPGCIVPNNK